jgi:hypothetical protein
VTGRASQTYVGGLRWKRGFAFWPLVRLTAASGALDLGPVAGIFRPLVPARELAPASIVSAERIARVGPFPAPGVRLLLDGESPLIFWTLRPGRLLAALEACGITVSSAAHAAPFWGT